MKRSSTSIIATRFLRRGRRSRCRSHRSATRAGAAAITSRSANTSTASGTDFSFRRVVVDLQQHLPVLAGHRVLAVRALVVTSEADSGHRVPFYFSPTIGGGNSLRGFSTFRFRDENLLLFQGEYRYHVNNFVTGAIFLDAGKVAQRTRDLGFDGMETTYGVGVRLGVNGGAGIRADIAFGGKSPRLVLGFSNVF